MHDIMISPAAYSDPYSVYSYQFKTSEYFDLPEIKEEQQEPLADEQQKEYQVGFISSKQRKAANERERKRMHSINKGFDILRARLPTPPYAKKMSKVDTLRNAIDYITKLNLLLSSNSDVTPEAAPNPAAHQRHPAVPLREARTQTMQVVDPVVGPCNITMGWQVVNNAYSNFYLDENDQKYAQYSNVWMPPNISTYRF